MSNAKITLEKLSKDNENVYKQLFKRCFPDNWKQSVPFPKDDIVTATLKDKVVGFCFVHSTPPYPMANGAGHFMYNLCVDPKVQRRGIASQILKFVTLKYQKVYAHSLYTNKAGQQLMKKLNWSKIGIWRNSYIEYSYGFEVKSKEVELLNSNHYDAIENVIYLA